MIRVWVIKMAEIVVVGVLIALRQCEGSESGKGGVGLNSYCAIVRLSARLDDAEGPMRTPAATAGMIHRDEAVAIGH